jgi:FtsP/CotA-like multicopper oxidase with cupredoxin domain
MTPSPARHRSSLTGLVLSLALLAGASACGGSGADPAASAGGAGSAGGAAAAPAAPATSVKEISVVIAAKTVTPPPGRIDVTKGQTVRITVTSDVADEAHVHGYDKEASLQPGIPTTIEFVADQDGLFEVETHESGLQLLQLAVR